MGFTFLVSDNSALYVLNGFTHVTRIQTVKLYVDTVLFVTYHVDGEESQPSVDAYYDQTEKCITFKYRDEDVGDSESIDEWMSTHCVMRRLTEFCRLAGYDKETDLTF